MKPILIFFLAATALAQPKKTVFMITDAEGVAGICRQDQTDPKDAELRALLTGEINAAVDGLYAGGADEVLVWDGHDGSQTLSALTIHPRAKLIMGKLSVNMTFDRKYTALVFVGQHARANSRGGVMAHSYSSLGIQNMIVNGHPVGEIETNAALAGYYGTPVLFLSGDADAVADLHAIVPDAVTAEVKEGFSNYSCETLSAQASRDLIRKRAELAMKKLGEIKPYRIEGPVTIQLESTSRYALDVDAGLRPGAEVMDARTVRYQGKDFLDAWTKARAKY
jgi:D-amino peptidase